MATAKSPFKNAAAAIYAACVSKEHPSLPEDASAEAVSFLDRCVAACSPHTTYLFYYAYLHFACMRVCVWRGCV